VEQLSPNSLNSKTFPDSPEEPIFILKTETYRNVLAKLYDNLDTGIDNRKWKLSEFYSRSKHFANASNEITPYGKLYQLPIQSLLIIPKKTSYSVVLTQV